MEEQQVHLVLVQQEEKQEVLQVEQEAQEAAEPEHTIQ